MAWENTSVKFSISVDYDDRVMKSIDASTKISGGTYYQSAMYYLENGKDLKLAQEWIIKRLMLIQKLSGFIIKKLVLKSSWRQGKRYGLFQKIMGGSHGC